MRIDEGRYKDGRIKYTYEFRHYGEHRTGTAKGCTTLSEAQEYVAQLMKKISEAKRGLIDKSHTITLKEMFEPLKESTIYNSSASHAFNQLKDIERFIGFFGADTVIADITTADLEAFRIKRLKEGVNQNTVKHSISTISKAFNDCIISNRLNLFNPCKALKPYNIEPTPPNPVTVEEWQAIKPHLPEHLRYICLIMLQTGLRPTQVRHLKWEQIDLTATTPHIKIRKKSTGNKGGKFYTVPITDVLLPIFKEIGVKESGYILLNPYTNKPYRDNRTAFYNAVRKAGIKRKIVLYNLKDSVGTTMASAGISPEAIRDTFNHSSYEISKKYIATVKADVINALKTLKDFN